MTEEDVMLLTVNELARVFHDRCVPEDRDKVLVIISEGLRRYFKVSTNHFETDHKLGNWHYFGLNCVIFHVRLMQPLCEFNL